MGNSFLLHHHQTGIFEDFATRIHYFKKMATTSGSSASRLTSMLTLSIVSAVLGMLQFGFHTGVINAPQKTVEAWIAKVHQDRTGSVLSDTLKSFIWLFIVSIFAVGGMVGGFSGKRKIL